MHRSLLLLAGHLCSALLSAQLVFIPDEQLRAVLNYQVPGCVDENGYLDPSYPGVEGIGSVQLESTASSPIDLTGLDALPGSLSLTLFSGSGEPFQVTFSPWPSQLVSLYLSGVSNATIPPLPSTLRWLVLSDCGSLTTVPSLPSELRFLLLSNLPQVSGISQFPVQLNYLRLDHLGWSAIPDLPAALDSLDVFYLNDLAALPPFPSELLFLHIDSAASLTALPDMPSGMATAWLWNFPLVTAPQFGDHMEMLQLWNLSELETIPVLPQQVTQLTIGYCPLLDTVPPIAEGCEQFDLFGSPRIHHLPLLPVSLYRLWLTDMDSLANLQLFPAQLTDLTLQVCSLVTDLGVLPNTLEILSLNYMPSFHQLPILPDSLRTLVLGDGTLITCLPALPEHLEHLYDTDVNLNCLPNHPASLVDFPAYLADILCLADVGSCASTYPRASGTVFHDVNANGVRDAGEPGLPNVSITALPLGIVTGSDPLGHFELVVPVDALTLTCQGIDPWVASVSPSEHIAFLAEPGMVDSLNDFGLALEPDVHDLRVSAVSTPARPGFTNDVWLSVLNGGSVEQDASLRMITDTAQTFVAAEPAPTASSGDTLWWDLPQLAVYEQRQVLLVLGTPAEIPIGTPLTQDILAGPLPTDSTPSDNVLLLADTVVSAFDPNDKRVEPSVITADQVTAGERLYYTIRFQNTGNFPAERVLLTDDLPSEIDRFSFRFEGSSHPCAWSITNGELQVLFEPIDLPYEDQDEPGSHGYFRFSIRVVNTLLPGAQFPNIANIYFDFNEAVITEPAWVTVDSPTAMDDQRADRLMVWPNPTHGDLHVLGANSPATLSLSTIDGRQVLALRRSGVPIELDMGALPAGTYLLHVDQLGERMIRRVVKL